MYIFGVYDRRVFHRLLYSISLHFTAIGYIAPLPQSVVYLFPLYVCDYYEHVCVCTKSVRRRESGIICVCLTQNTKKKLNKANIGDKAIMWANNIIYHLKNPICQRFFVLILVFTLFSLLSSYENTFFFLVLFSHLMVFASRLLSTVVEYTIWISREKKKQQRKNM